MYLPTPNAEPISRELFRLSRPNPAPADVTTHLVGWQVDGDDSVLNLPQDVELPIDNQATDTELRTALSAMRDGDKLLQSEIDATVTALLGTERAVVWDALPTKWKERNFPDTPFPVDGEHWADDWVQPTGAQDAYAKDAWAWHNGVLWVSLADANTYEPGVVGTWRDPFTRWPAWIQPPGAGFGYPAGFEVSHGGAKWRNDVADNTFEPGVSGWSNIIPAPADVWAPGIAVSVGEEYWYPDTDGTLYRVIQAHTTQTGWEPPNVPALWEVA